MLRKTKWNIITIVLIVILVFVWTGTREEKPEKSLPNLPGAKVELSALPENLQQSLELIENKALNKQKEIDKNLFKLDFISRLKGRTIAASTPLVLQVNYNHSRSEWVTSMPSSFVGLTKEQLASVLETWEIKQYSPDKALIISRTLSGLSPEEKKYQHLGIKDRKVAIFYGKKGNNNLKQLTNIKIYSLSEPEKDELENEILVSSEEELLAILEGLMSSINRD